MRRWAVGSLFILLLLPGCAEKEDPNASLRADNAALTDQVNRMEQRLAKLEREMAQLQSRQDETGERLRDVAAVVDKVTVRLDRVER